jgi:hypothetical protein
MFFKKTKIGFVFLAFASMILLTGCLSAPAYYPPPYPTTYQPPIPHTAFNFMGYNGWQRYDSWSNGFHIYKPVNWEVTEMNLNEINAQGSMQIDTSMFKDNIYYLSAPDEKGFVMVYSASASPERVYINSDQTEISDSFYNGFLTGAVNSFGSGSTVTNVQRDPTYYIINGNPARHVSFDVHQNGEDASIDGYLISSGNDQHVAMWWGYSGATADDTAIGKGIVSSIAT